jgi:hypothetical protein
MPHFRSLALLTGLLALVALPATAQRKVELDKEYKDKGWGYQIRPLKDWNSMPPDQDERLCVGRWKLSLDEFEKRGDYQAMRSGGYCELKILRVQVKVETPRDAAGDKPKEDEKPKDDKLEELRRRLQAGGIGDTSNVKNIEEWITAEYPEADKRWVRTPLKGARMPGELIEFGKDAVSVTIGVFKNSGVEWAVVYTAFEENYRKTWRDTYVKSLQSFSASGAATAEVADASRKDPNKLEGEEKRAALKASVAGKPGWFTVDTKYYVFISNADRAFVEKLARELEVVREKVYVPNFKPRNTKQPLNPVRIFATQSEYHQFGGPGGSAGYFSPPTGELVLFQKFDDMSATKSKDDCRSVMFHEGFHQYIHFAVGDVSPHSWFNEGHGDYFAGLTIAGNALGKAQVFDWRVDHLKQHMQQGKDLIPLRSLLRYEQREYYTNAGLKYSQGWAFIYYVREVTKDKALRQALDTYFNYLADNVTAFRSSKKEGEDAPPSDPRLRLIDFEDATKVKEILSAAVDKAFAGIDLEKVDKDLREWVKSL